MLQFKHSIFFKITILFVCALLSFFAISYYFIEDHIQNENLLSEFRYNQYIVTINEIMQYGGNIDLIKRYLDKMQFSPVENDIKKSLQEVNKIPSDFSGIFAKAVNTQDGIYILLETADEAILYKDHSRKSYKNFYIITLVGIILLTFVFFVVLKSLMPLKTFKEHVKQFAEGDNSNIHYNPNAKDEIGELQNEFYKSSNQIKSLNEARSLLLRSIMHELKTPITKGRIIAEMVQDTAQKQKLCSAFTRLNELINEFAKIEQISSKNYHLNKQEFLLQDLIDHTKEMLLIDKNTPDDPITLNAPDALIKADFDLFAIAIKNLLDNAIKYSSDGKVQVYIKNDRLYLTNKGQALQYEFKEYFKPYFKNPQKPSSQGFGLGMYIIKNTLDAQGFKFSYKHKDGVNIFIIHYCVVENYCLLK